MTAVQFILPALVVCALTDSSTSLHLLCPFLQVQFEMQQGEHFVLSQKAAEWHAEVLLASLTHLQEIQYLHRSAVVQKQFKEPNGKITSL